MHNDELFNRKLYNLKNDIQDYINNIYLKEILPEYLPDLLSFLEKWDKDEYMLNNITVGLAIESKLSLSDIEEYKINREISRVLFDIYISNILANTDFKNIKILYADNIEKIYRYPEFAGLVKAEVVDNVRELYNNGITNLNDFTLYLFKDKNHIRLTIYDPNKHLKIFTYNK